MSKDGNNNRRYCATCEKWIAGEKLLPKFHCPCCHFKTRGRGNCNYSIEEKQRRYSIKLKRY